MEYEAVNSLEKQQSGLEKAVERVTAQCRRLEALFSTGETDKPSFEQRYRNWNVWGIPQLPNYSEVASYKNTFDLLPTRVVDHKNDQYATFKDPPNDIIVDKDKAKRYSEWLESLEYYKFYTIDAKTNKQVKYYIGYQQSSENEDAEREPAVFIKNLQGGQDIRNPRLVLDLRQKWQWVANGGSASPSFMEPKFGTQRPGYVPGERDVDNICQSGSLYIPEQGSEMMSIFPPGIEQESAVLGIIDKVSRALYPSNFLRFFKGIYEQATTDMANIDPNSDAEEIRNTRAVRYNTPNYVPALDRNIADFVARIVPLSSEEIIAGAAKITHFLQGITSEYGFRWVTTNGRRMLEFGRISVEPFHFEVRS